MAPKEETKDKPEGAKEGKGKGKGKEKKETTAKKAQYTKEQALQQITSLNPDDDERETASKKISWILRKGAPRVGIKMSEAGWVKFSDLVNAELLDDVPDKSDAKILSIIEESNQQKLRYDMEDRDDGKYIKAVKREDRKKIESGGKAETSKGEKKEVSLAGAADSSTGLRADAAVFQPGAMTNMYGGGYGMMGYPFGGYPWGYGSYGYGYGQTAATGDAKDRRFTGRIKSFNTEKGYGFIESPEAYQVYGRDVFLHKAHVGSFAVGAVVSFQAQLNKEGMPQARELQSSDGTVSTSKGKGSKGKGKGKKDKGDGKGGEKKAKGEGKKKKKDEGSKDEKTDDKAEESAEAKPAEGEAAAADAGKS